MSVKSNQTAKACVRALQISVFLGFVLSLFSLKQTTHFVVHCLQIINVFLALIKVPKCDILKQHLPNTTATHRLLHTLHM